MASSLPASAGPGAGGRRSWRPAAIVAGALAAVLLVAVLADGRLLVADGDPSAVTDADIRLARSLFGNATPPESMAQACFDEDGTIDPGCLGDGQPGGAGGDITADVVPRGCRRDTAISASCVERELGIDVPDRCTDSGGAVDVGCMAEGSDLLVLTDRCIDDGRLDGRCLSGRVYGVPDPGPESDEVPSGIDVPVADPDGDPRDQLPLGDVDDVDAPEEAPDPEPADGPLEWLVPILQILAAVALVLGLLAALALWLRGLTARPGAVEPDIDDEAHDREVMAASLDASAQQLDLSGDPRQAIIAAYAMLLEGLAACAQGHRPSETPLEHLERVLAALDVRPDPLRELTTLFGEARFSDHVMTEAQRDRARAALGEAAADLDRVREAVG